MNSIAIDRHLAPARSRLRFALLLSFLALFGLAAPGTAQEERPNVLFIALDDLNDWVGVLGGHPQARTPNIDRLAERGTLFTNAHCPAPLCNASRVAIMTGIRPSTSGIYYNRQSFRKVMPEVVTLPQHFMESGYRAVGGGKIYHGRWPDPESWNDYFPSMEQSRPTGGAPVGKRPLHGYENLKSLDWGPLERADEEMSDHKVVDWAIGELAQEHDQPFFLAVGIYRPHLPWFVPEKYFDAFEGDEVAIPTTTDDDLNDVPPIGRRFARGKEDEHGRILGHDAWQEAVTGYLAAIAFADAQVGRLLDALDESAHARDTVIVLWGDHGWHLGEKRHWRKYTLWEEATRVPLIMAGPGVTPAGVSSRPVNLIDLYPTLVEMCGLPKREACEGVSLVPLLRDPEALWSRPSLTTYGRNNHSLRSERWRYIRYSDGTEELYDHERDPAEWKNLADKPKYAPVIEELSAFLPKKNVRQAEMESVRGKSDEGGGLGPDED